MEPCDRLFRPIPSPTFFSRVYTNNGTSAKSLGPCNVLITHWCTQPFPTSGTGSPGPVARMTQGMDRPRPPGRPIRVSAWMQENLQVCHTSMRGPTGTADTENERPLLLYLGTDFSSLSPFTSPVQVINNKVAKMTSL